jgi:hypothetical protein
VKYYTVAVDMGQIRFFLINHNADFGIYLKSKENWENGFRSANV